MVVYQVYPRSFADSDGDGVGDLAGVTAHLDHLAWLGVDALWLSPIHPSPMADGGYDVADYLDVDPRFGTVADLEELARQARARGIALLLDVVPCHTSIEHPWFTAHPERYVWSPMDGPPNNWRGTFGGSAWSPDPHGRGWYLHSFYPEQPDLDWREPAVADALGEVLRTWRRRGVAGFRLDALQQLLKDPQLRDDPPASGRFPFPHDAEYGALEHVNSGGRPGVGAPLAALREAAGPDAFLVGEVYLPAARQKPYLEHLDAAFCFELLFAAWDAAALRDAIAVGLAGGKPAWVLSNHDFPRLRDRIGPQNVRAAALLLLALPGPAFVYQGDELGAGNGPGRAGAPDDRAGRDPYRHPMAWTTQDEHHGFTEGTPWLPVSPPPGGAVDAQRDDPASMLHLVRALIALRRRLGGPVSDLTAVDGLLAFTRGTSRVLVNASGQARSIGPLGGVILATHDVSEGRLPPGAAVIGELV